MKRCFICKNSYAFGDTGNGKGINICSKECKERLSTVKKVFMKYRGELALSKDDILMLISKLTPFQIAEVCNQENRIETFKRGIKIFRQEIKAMEQTNKKMSEEIKHQKSKIALRDSLSNN